MKSLGVGGPLCLIFPIPMEGTQQGPQNIHRFGGQLGVAYWGARALGVPQQCLGGHRILGCRSLWGVQLGVQNPLRAA